MDGLLTPWGIDERAERLYRALLRRPGSSRHDLADLLGWAGEAEVDRAAHPLLAARLVREAAGSYVALAPETAVGRLLDREESRLQRRLREVVDARSTVGDFLLDHAAGQGRPRAEEALAALDPDRALGALAELAATTTGPVRVHCAPDWLAAADERVGQLLGRLLAGRTVRVVYPVAVLDDDAQLDRLRRQARRGGAARVAAAVDRSFLVFGDAGAVMPAAPGTDGHLLVRTPALVATLRDLFDVAWHHASPLPTPVQGRPADARDSALLELLALGAKDETVARRLGVSLRTVRRRTAQLMHELGATTRFQAGREASRRGLV
ncbi:hypothetical protein [Vallicoccus soli]|uniref:HTH luxR-type domain-containing protein n=1 Tax=Vallicoccus soli TaxID=2339232 RepID=A0A3A3ZGG8_9ACTN|nr:hypothetical protein [Vallicoccus soli]RJK94302.1 hypothetical protein D5H78_15080 [Vallicoccus soli]